LSSIIIGIFSWGYSRFQEHNTLKHTTEERISSVTGISNKFKLTLSTFPELEQRNLYSLLFELKILTKSTGQFEIDKPIRAVRTLNEFVTNNASSETDTSSDSSVNASDKKYITNLIDSCLTIDRWKNLP